MGQFISNILEAARTADQRKEITIYDVIGAMAVAVVFVSIFIIASSIESLI